MALSLGATTLAALYLGSTAISTAYLGSVQVYDAGGAAFDPVSLFASGEEGALFLPGPTTSFLSTTDLTPAGAGDTVGFQLDTSQGAGYSGGSFTGLGSELVTNGDFSSSDTGWSELATNGTYPRVVGGVAEISRGSFGLANTYYQVITTEVGKTYIVEGSVVSVSNTIFPSVQLTSDPLSDSLTSLELTSSGAFNFAFTATETAHALVFYLSLNTTASFDNISVRELPGRMQTQITVAARPTLQDSPDQIDFDGIDDFHRVVLPAMSNATVAYASPGVGAVILTGQTITAGNYDWDTDHAGLIILDRPLTASETTGLTAFLNARAGV
jgi:hypothetical protein